jgi:HSP20 family protein
MSTRVLTKPSMAPIFNDFFRPWNEWFDDSRLINKVSNVPAVNIKEDTSQYNVSLAIPGLKKDDFSISVEGNMLTVSSEKEEKKEEKDEKFTHKEYSYASFSRSFALPEDVKQDAIEAKYDEGVLNIRLPRRENGKKISATKQITVK